MTIDESIIKLKKEFKKIRRMGYVEGCSLASGDVGLTLERLLGKDVDNFELPDYFNIELKAQKKFGFGIMTLFNATPDGKYLFSIKRLKENYGYPDRILKWARVLQGDVNAKSKNKIGLYYSYLLKVDYVEKRIYLYVYDSDDKLIDKDTYWSFDLLEEKLTRKLSVLAFVETSIKNIDNKNYYKYLSLKILKLKGFDTFIKLIEEGIVSITFTIGVFRTGKRRGEIHDHGTAFRISSKNLLCLFKRY